MTPTDTGPLVALLQKGERENYVRCLRVFATLSRPLVTTQACFTEAMYLLGRDAGYAGQDSLWQMQAEGRLILHPNSDAEMARMRDLMTQYRDTPMDYADASLVALMEALRLQRVFTLDHHFYAYRTAGGDAFEVVP